MLHNRALIFDEAEQFVSRVKYKPGFKFEVDFEPIGLLFQADMKVPDVTTKGHTPCGVTGKRVVTWMSLDVSKKDRIRRYIKAIHGLLMDGETHELDEWLEIDGVRLFDPHEKPSKLQELEEMLLEKLNKALGGDNGQVAV